jgi:hypothetical protein
MKIFDKNFGFTLYLFVLAMQSCVDKSNHASKIFSENGNSIKLTLAEVVSTLKIEGKTTTSHTLLSTVRLNDGEELEVSRADMEKEMDLNHQLKNISIQVSKNGKYFALSNEPELFLMLDKKYLVRIKDKTLRHSNLDNLPVPDSLLLQIFRQDAEKLHLKVKADILIPEILLTTNDITHEPGFINSILAYTSHCEAPCNIDFILLEAGYLGGLDLLYTDAERIDKCLKNQIFYQKFKTKFEQSSKNLENKSYFETVLKYSDSKEFK